MPRCQTLPGEIERRAGRVFLPLDSKVPALRNRLGQAQDFDTLALDYR